MIFQVGKVYQGYEVESRTKCFVKFTAETKRRKIEVFECVETAPVYTYPQGVETIVNVTAVEDAVVESTPPIETESTEVTAPDTHAWIEPSANSINEPIAISGALDDEPIIVIDSNNQAWRLVATDTQTCLFEAVEHREIGNAPRTRTMPLKALQALFGWGAKCKYTRPCADGFGIQVYVGDERYGFALAEPIWAEREDDPDWAALARERMDRMWDRDCDHAANFGMAALI